MELFTYTFMQYALIGGLSMSVLAGLLGPFVVASRQSYASDMFAHVALAGIGIALLLGSNPWWGALPMLILIATLFWWLEMEQIYSPDSLAILFLSGGLAVALATVSLAENQIFSFENYLFGSILTLTSTDLFAMIGSTLLIGIILKLLWYPLIGATQSPVFTMPFSMRPQLVRLLFFWILTVVVWIGIKTIGGLLIGALLVIPTLTVRAYAQSFAQLVALSTIVSVISMTIGIIASAFFDLPPSSLIIGTLIIVFILQLLIPRKQD